MGTAAGGKAYFQRGSLLWFTVIILSFGYYTVRAAAALSGPKSGASAPLSAGPGPAGPEGSRRRNKARSPGGGDRAGKEDAGALVCPRLSRVSRS